MARHFLTYLSSFDAWFTGSCSTSKLCADSTSRSTTSLNGIAYYLGAEASFLRRSSLITTLRSIGMVSNTVRPDTRSFFYASTNHQLISDGTKDVCNFGVLEKLLQDIGPEGAAFVPSIPFKSGVRSGNFGCRVA
jgi:hypothetical protein